MKVIITIIRVRESMSLIPRHEFILIRPEMDGRPIRECLGHKGSQYAGADSIALAFISERDVINVEIVTVSLVIGSDDEAQEHTPGTLSCTKNHDAGFVISAIPGILKV